MPAFVGIATIRAGFVKAATGCIRCSWSMLRSSEACNGIFCEILGFPIFFMVCHLKASREWWVGFPSRSPIGSCRHRASSSAVRRRVAGRSPIRSGLGRFLCMGETARGEVADNVNMGHAACCLVAGANPAGVCLCGGLWVWNLNHSHSSA